MNFNQLYVQYTFFLPLKDNACMKELNEKYLHLFLENYKKIIYFSYFLSNISYTVPISMDFIYLTKATKIHF